MRELITRIKLWFLHRKLDKELKEYYRRDFHARCPRCGFPIVYPGGKGHFCWACEHTWEN